MKKVVAVSLLALATLTICGCPGTYNPNQGFTIQTDERLAPAICSPYVPCPIALLGPAMGISGTPVSGNYQHADAENDPVLGSVGTFSGKTNDNDQYWVNNGMAPANWQLFATFNHFCGYPNLYAQGVDVLTGNPQYKYQVYEDVENLSTQYYDCVTYSSSTGQPESLPSASTNFAIVGQLPSSITLGTHPETPFVTTYGMPQLFIMDGTPTGGFNLVATETATSVDPSGATATFPLPSLSQNGYSLEVANTAGDGSPDPAATNILSVASSQSISGSPFGVAAGGMTTLEKETIKEGNHFVGPFTIEDQYTPLPVVSLYSNNQVMIAGTAVGVGPSPTAVVAFPGPSSVTTQNEGTTLYQTTISGTTLGAVTNSGSNTISILDLINKDVLSTVTVGNQPVAIVADSAGANAYVANYSDGTVSQVNLSSYAVTNTVAVGGNPTSVTLSSGGTLWVGGVGFLTEINTSNMSIVATESTGRTITALGYDDSYGEVIATSSDASGNVYADTVNASGVTQGGTYTPAASTAISTMPTYFNPRIQAYSFGMTQTVTSSHTPIQTTQPGAPPIIVQDGWIVVTATPTGFAVSDASATSNAVIFSTPTSSPVAGIAVDTQLNAAYLTMPDSNTLLTVPLPGPANQ